jgi:hypothetical protein
MQQKDANAHNREHRLDDAVGYGYSSQNWNMRVTIPDKPKKTIR